MGSWTDVSGERVPDEWARAFEWVEKTVGGRVVRCDRQARWRPAWFLDVEMSDPDATTRALYLRGDRGNTDHGVYPLEHEMRVLQVLESQGILVPHIYGFCDFQRAILMDRAPGRANLATAEDDEERRAVLVDYVDWMAKMHRLDLAPFEAAGLEVPVGERALAYGDYDSWEKSYRTTRKRPEPLIEFCMRWLGETVPSAKRKAAFIAADAGQFMFDRGKVTALIDLELACIGDPSADLAGLRCRDLSEPLGDLGPGFDHYAERMGEPIDHDAVDWHTVRFGLYTPMACSGLVSRALPGIDFAQYQSWYLVYGRVPLEIIAAREGVALAPLAPAADAPAHASVAHEQLVMNLEAMAAGGGFEAYRADSSLRIAQYLRECDKFGAAFVRQDLEDAESLLGSRPESVGEMEEKLERFVLEAPRTRYPEIIPVLHRRLLRQEALLRPAMRELTDAKVQILR